MELSNQFHWQISGPLGRKSANEKDSKFHSAEGFAAIHTGLLSQAALHTISAEAV